MSEKPDVHSGEHTVEGWSAQRLPFEPKGPLKEYGERLRAALRDLEPVEGKHLRAVYASPDRDFADVENVLLYNLGTGCYRHLTASGMEVMRTASADGLHRMTYSLTNRWAEEVVGGDEFARVSLEQLPSGPDKPAPWWAAAREHLTLSGTAVAREYTVSVQVRAEAQRFVSLVKPMLDGLIAALHTHDGSHGDHIRRSLAQYGDPDRLWALLNDPSHAVLGSRRLVRPHGSGIAWNPADDLCAGFRVIRSSTGPPIDATFHGHCAARPIV
ncbi:MAG: hypothetical protein WAW88_02960 [Nocardioides sp.]